MLRPGTLRRGESGCLPSRSNFQRRRNRATRAPAAQTPLRCKGRRAALIVRIPDYSWFFTPSAAPTPQAPSRCERSGLCGTQALPPLRWLCSLVWGRSGPRPQATPECRAPPQAALGRLSALQSTPVGRSLPPPGLRPPRLSVVFGDGHGPWKALISIIISSKTAS